jgi:hypothetical protein
VETPPSAVVVRHAIAVHTPTSHARPFPHVAPLRRLLPLSTHVATPGVTPVQLVTPMWQAFAVSLHTTPALQLQSPLGSQNVFALAVPHGVPGAASVPWSTQVAPAVLHDNVPLWQGLAAGEHASPRAQTTHSPLSQTPFAPHSVPSGTFPVNAPHVPSHENSPV